MRKIQVIFLLSVVTFLFSLAPRVQADSRPITGPGSRFSPTFSVWWGTTNGMDQVTVVGTLGTIEDFERTSPDGSVFYHWTAIDCRINAFVDGVSYSGTGNGIWTAPSWSIPGETPSIGPTQITVTARVTDPLGNIYTLQSRHIVNENGVVILFYIRVF